MSSRRRQGSYNAAERAASRAFSPARSRAYSTSRRGGGGTAASPKSPRRSTGSDRYNNNGGGGNRGEMAALSGFETVRERRSATNKGEWRRALMHVGIATAAEFFVAAAILYVVKPPMVMEPKKDRFEEPTVSVKRVSLWSLVVALAAAVISIVIIYRRFKKGT